LLPENALAALREGGREEEAAKKEERSRQAALEAFL
jgi:hypothetical protein